MAKDTATAVRTTTKKIAAQMQRFFTATPVKKAPGCLLCVAAILPQRSAERYRLAAEDIMPTRVQGGGIALARLRRDAQLQNPPALSERGFSCPAGCGIVPSDAREVVIRSKRLLWRPSP
jgi:hypothetical protein